MKGFVTEPALIEKKSLEIISGILSAEMPEKLHFSPAELTVVKRVIHTTADFEYTSILEFNNDPITAITLALQDGCHIITDTVMALSGINKRVPVKYGVQVKCFMSDEIVAKEAREKGVTRAMISMEKAALDPQNGIYVIGNAPTALVKLLELVEQGYRPRAIIGVPVGFVGALESKELLAASTIPHIVSRGRKGGSNVAAAIMNAISYLTEE